MATEFKKQVNIFIMHGDSLQVYDVLVFRHANHCFSFMKQFIFRIRICCLFYSNFKPIDGKCSDTFTIMMQTAALQLIPKQLILDN